VNRQQFALIAALGLITTLPCLTAATSAKAGDWKTNSEENGASTLSGKLYRNSADQSGTAPYLLLDRWGVVRGYVAAGRGVDLESSLGQQVSLQGTIRTLPGGDMPYMTCEKLLGGNAEAVAAPPPAPIGSALAAIGSTEEPTVKPVHQANSLPLREVVLEPQAVLASDANQNAVSRVPARRTDPRRTRHTGGRATAYQEPIPAPAPNASGRAGQKTPEPLADPGPAIEGGSMIAHGPMESEGAIVEGPTGPIHSDCDSCDGRESCDSCGDCAPSDACSDEFDAAWGPHRPLFTIGPTGLWVKADYLLWAENGTHIPALVTQGSVNDQHPGALGQPNTTVLYGDEKINDEVRSGFRFQAGLWMNRCCTFGFEGEYLILGDEESLYHRWSDGNPVLARPFEDASLTPSQPRAQLVAFPRGNANSLDGSIDVAATTHFNGAGARFLFVLCRQDGCWTDECPGMSFHDRYRATFTAGYRYLNLEDQLGITENLTTTAGVVPISATETIPGTEAFVVNDQFNTHNSFNGGELGLKFEFQRNRWGIDFFPRVGLGSTHSTVTIKGSTTVTDVTGVETTAAGGLLAQPTTNMGSYARDLFSVVPEIDVNLSYQLTPHAKFIVGYNFLYWNNVARAGEQIDPVVNSSVLPNSPVAPTGDTSRPRFTFSEGNFWAQGLNVGLDCRW
jgi:hypothetical protein